MESLVCAMIRPAELCTSLALRRHEPTTTIRTMTASATPLTADTERKVAEISRCEILIGIPSYNNATTIGHVVRAVSAGLAKYFPDARAVLVNSDGGSSDGTP